MAPEDIMELVEATAKSSAWTSSIRLLGFKIFIEIGLQCLHDAAGDDALNVLKIRAENQFCGRCVSSFVPNESYRRSKTGMASIADRS